MTSDRGIFLTRVARRRTICREYFELTLTTPIFPSAAPGQFLQILCRSPYQGTAPSNIVAMLRRPFSIAGLRRPTAGAEIDILGRVVGPGTAWLDARRAGDEVDVLGPLGSSFSLPTGGETAVLVAGGVGLPPIRWLGEVLRKNGANCASIVGAQTRNMLPVTLRAEPSTTGDMTLCVDEFARDAIPTCVTTDDGSCGLRGRVTEGLMRCLNRLGAPAQLRVYTCGPEPMLKAVAKLCSRRGVACEAALERVMGCGLATCQSCVVPVRDPARVEGWRYALCCREGPVFDAARVVW